MADARRELYACWSQSGDLLGAAAIPVTMYGGEQITMVELKPGERIVDDSDPRQVAIDALLAYKQTLDRKRVLIIEKDNATRSENFEAHFASNQAGRIWAALRILGVEP